MAKNFAIISWEDKYSTEAFLVIAKVYLVKPII